VQSFSGGSGPADVPYDRSVELPATRCGPKHESKHSLSPSLGCHVLRGGWILEFPRCRSVRFLINLPIVSYYEIGTALTANHAHTAFMGVYGMLAIGLGLFCLRYLLPAEKWSDRAAQFSFWSLNIGLAWMSFGTLFPLGIIQLYHSVSAGYYEARSMKFLTSGINTMIEWIRLPGDLLFIVGIFPSCISAGWESATG